MERIVYDDCHWRGPHQIDFWDQLNEDVKAAKENPNLKVVTLGDMIDLKNARYKEVELAKADIRLLQKVVDFYVGGNHELPNKWWLNTVIRDPEMDAIYAHWPPYWSDEYAKDYFEKHTPGASWFKRRLVWAGSHWRKIKSVEHSDEHMFRAIKYAQHYRVTFVITGHRHPKEIVYRWQNGVCLMALPRGRNVITKEFLESIKETNA